MIVEALSWQLTSREQRMLQQPYGDNNVLSTVTAASGCPDCMCFYWKNSTSQDFQGGVAG